MIITNNFNLPNGFIKANEGFQHERADNCFSVTTLHKGTCEIALDKLHYNEAEQDVSDMVWAIFGSAVHSIFEKGEGENEFSEISLKYEIMPGIFWTGKSDLYDMKNNIIKDFKTASIWKVKFNDFDDWRKQLLDYCSLLELVEGIKCRKGQIIALLKDHSKTEAQRDCQYPQSPVYTINFEFTDKEVFERVKIAKDKILEVQKAIEELKQMNSIAPCSEKERWAKPTKFAVMKNGRKTAVKLFDDEGDAEALAHTDSSYYVEKREGANTKCEGYCLYKKWCPLFSEDYLPF